MFEISLITTYTRKSFVKHTCVLFQHRSTLYPSSYVGIFDKNIQKSSSSRTDRATEVTVDNILIFK